MNKIIAGIFSICLLHTAVGQTTNRFEPSLNNYYNNFQTFTNSTLNADSAFFYLQKLASDKRFSFYFTDVVHNQLAQSLVQKVTDSADTTAVTEALARRFTTKQIIGKIMADTNKLLQQAAAPINLLVSIQEAGSDQNAQAVFTNDFTDHQLSEYLLYNQRTGRYGLMIYQLIDSQPALKMLAEKLLHQLHQQFKSHLVAANDSMSRSALNERAWYRNMYATANYFEAGATKNPTAKLQLLKKAFDFSPDLFDINHSGAYFYDKVLLFNDEAKSFKDDYLEMLTKSGGERSKVLSTLLQIALVEPEYKNRLAEYYKANKPASKSFKAYWLEAVDAVALKSPKFFLISAGKKAVSSTQFSGKWTLIDFWGTWCGPCREEHPAMQQFYDSIVVPKSKQLSLLTIACRDTQTKVSAYMADKKYSFPVIMSDNLIERSFFVTSYPTKILLTPKGKYITVPFNTDWVNFVTQYAGL